MESKTIDAGEFRANCAKLLNIVRDAHTEVIITKRGKAVAKLVPCYPDIFGRMRGTVKIFGDIVGPSSEEWEANCSVADKSGP